MDNSNTIKDQLLYVVTETTKEMNRVLNVWRCDDILRSSDEYKSLFRTYFFKFMQIKFGWSRCQTMRYCNIVPVTISDRLVGISLNVSSYDTRETVIFLKEIIDNFDFVKCYNDYPPKEYKNAFRTDTSINAELSIESINFDNIKNIKF